MGYLSPDYAIRFLMGGQAPLVAWAFECSMILWCRSRGLSSLVDSSACCFSKGDVSFSKRNPFRSTSHPCPVIDSCPSYSNPKHYCWTDFPRHTPTNYALPSPPFLEQIGLLYKGDIRRRAVLRKRDDTSLKRR